MSSWNFPRTPHITQTVLDSTFRTTFQTRNMAEYGRGVRAETPTGPQTSYCSGMLAAGAIRFWVDLVHPPFLRLLSLFQAPRRLFSLEETVATGMFSSSCATSSAALPRRFSP